MRSEKLEFRNKEGKLLSARLELPDSEASSYAIFVHCFTCSKDFHAATRISRALTKSGLGVLRFDFTGLGNSDGDFSNTNFSTNISDLLSAYHHLSQSGKTTSLLIGHSLGGAAALASANEMPTVKGVVTINSPSEARHVEHLLKKHIDDIQKDGEAEINLGGKTFTIKKQFLDDIRQSSLDGKISTLEKALLIFYSPQDEVVSSDHARRIFDMASEPKSLISLHGASHLLNKKEDSEYIAGIITAWCERYFR